MAEKDSPSISVIIPSYNSAHLLPRAINSVIAQTVQVMEIIVIDDGSVDETPKMLSERFPQVKCISQPNQGVSAARNHGVEEAAGEWVAFLDADDEWKPDKTRKQISLLECHPEAVFITTGRYYAHQPKNDGLHGAFRWKLASLLAHNRVHTSSVLLKKKVFLDLGGFDPKLKTGEDWDLWLRIVHQYVGFGLAARETIRYKTAGSLSEDALRIGLNNITIMQRWNPDTTEIKGLAPWNFRRIVWLHTANRLRKLCRGKNNATQMFLTESFNQLPFSGTGRWLLRMLTGILQKIP